MRIGFVSHENPTRVSTWSGIPHHMIRGLSDGGAEVQAIGPLAMSRSHMLRRVAYRSYGKGYLPEREPEALHGYARQIALQARDCDVMFSPGSVALTNFRGAPVVFWTDATVASMVGYYPGFQNVARRSLEAAHKQEGKAIRDASLCVYASSWAAESAVRDYGAVPEKVLVVPFGANLADPGRALISDAIGKRGPRLRLLFIASDWQRKGGDFAVAVAHELGADLSIIGDSPGKELPPHVSYLGFLDKNLDTDRAKLVEALLTAHFLILPTRAECFGVVFCEASEFGVPSIAFDTGGVESAITNGRNGFLMQPGANPQDFARVIRRSLPDYRRYATCARFEYEERLNWDVSCRRVLAAMANIVANDLHPQHSESVPRK